MPPPSLADIQPKLYMSLVCMLAAVPCLALGWRDRSGPGRMLGVAALGLAVGMPPLFFKAYLPHVPTVIVANAVVLTAMSLLWHVSDRLIGRTGRIWTVAVSPAIWILCWLDPVFSHRLDVRIAVAALLSGTLLALPTITLWRYPARGLLHTLLLAVGASHVLVSAIRLVLAVRRSPLGASPAWLTFTELNMLAYVVLWPTLCLLLINQRWIEIETERGSRDELSGVLNRRGFIHNARPIERATVLLFDIDHFKWINDTYGHACGDEMIVAFSKLTSTCLGLGTVFARIGGEEFAAVLSHDEGRRPEFLANQVRLAFEALELPCGARTTVSVGIAHPIPGAPEEIEAALARADLALYRAKQTGRNRVEIWTEHAGGAFWTGEGAGSRKRSVDGTIRLIG